MNSRSPSALDLWKYPTSTLLIVLNLWLLSRVYILATPPISFNNGHTQTPHPQHNQHTAMLIKKATNNLCLQQVTFSLQTWTEKMKTCHIYLVKPARGSEYHRWWNPPRMQPACRFVAFERWPSDVVCGSVIKMFGRLGQTSWKSCSVEGHEIPVCGGFSSGGSAWIGESAGPASQRWNRVWVVLAAIRVSDGLN